MNYATFKTSLLDRINWPAVMAAPRMAGGHEDVQDAIFEGQAIQHSFWTSGDYQGCTAVAWLFPGGRVVIMTDSYGSCSGCDSWEDASDDDAKALVTTTVTSARCFKSLKEAREWQLTLSDDYGAEDYHFRDAAKLDLSVPSEQVQIDLASIGNKAILKERQDPEDPEDPEDLEDADQLTEAITTYRQAYIDGFTSMLRLVKQSTRITALKEGQEALEELEAMSVEDCRVALEAPEA